MTEARSLRVRPNDGIREYEQHMEAARRDNVQLQLTQSIISHAGALGRSISFAQLIATWADACTEREQQRRIRTTLPAKDADKAQDFVSRLHGLTATYYADRITAKDGRTDLKQELLKAAKPRIEAMSNQDFSKTARGGRLTEFVFVHRARHQFHSVAYRRRPATAEIMDPQCHGELIVSPREMNALVGSVLEAQKLVRMDLKRIEPLFNERELPLGALLHETFRNTAEHAYLDLRGAIPSKGLRCILITVQQAEPDELYPESLVSVEHPNLADYFARLRDRAGRVDRKKVHVLEISVLDTGPGFSETIAHQVDATNDSERVEVCFRDTVTSKPGPNSGLGLGRVLRHIKNLDGFVRVRTSTTEAFFPAHSQSSDEQLIPHVAGDLPKAVGTALTIAIPLEM